MFNKMNANKLQEAENIANGFVNQKVKVIKKDKGLMERTENEEKVILAEDNRQVLFG